MPGVFIPIAEESDLIVRMGTWVLQEACRWNARWQRAHLPPLPVAVNVSAFQFRQPDFTQTVLEALSQSGLAPQFLELELTESAFVRDAHKAIEILESLKRIGVKMSIDDFGTGYSSLSYLKKFPVDKLKIDQSFVRDLATDADDAAIVTATIQMAKGLGLRVIAEGVETAEQLDFLRKHGCDEIQGFLFAKPASAQDFTALLAASAHSNLPVA
jgi:EAL domain-containing protein (putative c-di-GMP-specific phosphodiesterase class I)